MRAELVVTFADGNETRLQLDGTPAGIDATFTRYATAGDIGGRRIVDVDLIPAWTWFDWVLIAVFVAVVVALVAFVFYNV